MIEWWSSLNILMKVLWGITLAASLIFVIQSILTFIGADGDFNADFDTGGDFDAGGGLGVGDASGAGDFGSTGGPDFGSTGGSTGGDISGNVSGDASGAHSGMGLLTFRNLVNFLLGFGWTAVLLRGQIASNAVLFTLATVIGVGLVTVVMLLFKWISGMQQSGNINVYALAEGCQGKVYLTIPGGRQGEGKVQITINNSIREYNAVTDGETLKTGTDIWVVEVVNESTLLVEKNNSVII